MKFKSKLSDWLLLLATTIAIILSIVLWIFIMTNDSRFSQINPPSSVVNQQVKTRNTKSLYDLYMPTASYGFRNGKLCRIYDPKRNLSLEFSKVVRSLQIKKLTLESSDQGKYESLLSDSKYVQLTYPDQITFGLFAGEKVKYNNREFNRVFIPQGTNKWFYVGNDKNNRLYLIKAKGANFNRLRTYAKKARLENTISFIKLRSGYVPFYNNSAKLRIFSYLTSKQSNSYFVSRLLGTSGISSRTSKKGRTTYALNYYTRLLVPSSQLKNNEYRYTHYEKNKHMTNTDYLLNSIYYVHRLGLTEQDLRFFDADGNNVKYVNYVEGSPAFWNKHNVQISTTFSYDSVKVAFNSTNLQIPIPYDGSTTTLSPTQELLRKLENHGLQETNIDNIVVGFRVEKDSTHTNLINLIPTYYVKSYGVWQSADEWLKQNMSIYRKNETVEERGTN